MNRPIDIRNWWSAYGLWATVLFSLECYWLGTRGPTPLGWLAPVSILASIITTLHLLTAPWAASRFWRPYLVKWLSWWIMNYVATVLGLCMMFGVFAVWQAMFDARILLSVGLVVPTIRIVQHALVDIRDLHEAEASPSSAASIYA